MGAFELTGWQADLGLLTRVLAATFLGGLIGIERELARKPAGFRTHMLVAASATLLVGLADVLVTRFSYEAYGGSLRADPIRIVEAVVTGVAFLGAGTIFRRDGDVVEGLTTAASILLAAAIGVAVALERWIVALGVTLLVLLVLRGIRGVEDRLERLLPDDEGDDG